MESQPVVPTLESVLEQIAHLQEAYKKLEAENVSLRLTNEKLLAQIEKLSIKKTSENSSLPPSKDIARKNSSLREKSGKKTGGQKGHKGTTLTFTGTPDAIEEVKPSACPACGADLSNAESTVVQSTHEIDIDFKRKVTPKNHHKVSCSCGYIHVPKRQPPVKYGPTLSGLATYLNVRHYLSFQRVTQFFAQVLGIPISEGTVTNKLVQIGQKSEPYLVEITKEIENSPVVGADETSLACNGKKNWFWCFQTTTATLIKFAETRKKTVLSDIFPKGLPNAIIVTDRYSSYNSFPCKGQQYCLAHLARNSKFLVSLEKTSWASDFLSWCKSCFSPNLVKSEIKEQLNQLLSETLFAKTPKTRTLLNSLRESPSKLTTFLDNPDVPPDNNASERAIRNVKCKLKVGTQFRTTAGAICYANLQSVSDTCAKIGGNVFKDVFVKLAMS